MSIDLSHFYVWTLNAKDGVPLGFREKMDFAADKRSEILKNLLDLSALSEQSSLLYISTCHRVELYAYQVSAQKIAEHWQKNTSPFLCRARSIEGKEALAHLFRVISSLESEVLGETQITGQVKDAASYCKELGLLKGPLERCLQWAQKAAKRVRTETKLSSGTVSVAHVAVDGLDDVFESLESKEALVVGAGPMAIQALERAGKRGLRKITWLNRTKEKIKSHALASQYEVGDFSQLSELFWTKDIIIMATATPKPLLNRELLSTSRPKERFQFKSPQVVLDLGHPRNVAEDVHGYEGFYVRNVDEFRDRASKNTENRKQNKAIAQNIVDEEVDKLVHSLNNMERGPLIGQLNEVLGKFIQDEVLNLKLEKHPEIVYLTRALHGKLVHRILEETESYDEVQSIEILKALVNAWRRSAQWPQKEVLENQGSQNPSSQKPKAVKSR